MRLVVKKLEIADLGQLQSLVIEHLDGIESGLTVIDSRLLLGHATMDIVALDADGTLVLVTAGFTADEEMLLKAVEAYSWCLEYPDAIRRLYPSVEISAARPPRLMFVVERLPDAFHRKIKQLGFSEVDCVEFRYLDMSGTPAAYFDTIARLPRGSGLAEFTPAPIARRVADLQPRRMPEPMTSERPMEKLVDRGDKVVPLASAPSAARATSVRLQKMLNTHGTGHGNAVAPVIEIGMRAAAPPAPPVETVIEPIVRLRLRDAVAAPAPAAVAPAPAPQASKPRISFAGIAKELLGAAAPAPRLEAPAVIPRPAVEKITRATLENIAAAAAGASAETDSAVAVAQVPEAKPAPVVAAAPKPMFTAPKPAAAAPKPAVPAPKHVAAAPKPVVAAPAPAAGVAAAPKPAVPAAKPAAEAPAPKPTDAEAPAHNLPQEFEGLKFPNDGVLTRQWMEFLNQMASSKW